MANSFLTVPVLNQPFCNNGTKNTIPNTVDQTQGLASLSTGFPPITSQRIADGGKPPKRADFNGAFNMISQRDYNQQIGGVEVFRQDVSAAIGGYPKDAILWFKPEADELPFMIVSLENNNTNTPTGLDTDTHWKKMSFGGGSSLPLGFHFWSDHELDDVSYLRADTFSWQPKTGYEEFYNLLVDQYNDESSTTETDQGITYKLTPKKYKIADASQMQAIADRYDSTGKSWYYILDEENERFKLPRSKYNSYMSQVAVKGNGMAIGYSNGTVNFGYLSSASVTTSGQSVPAYGSNVGTSSAWGGLNPGDGIVIGLTTDSTKSGMVADLKTDDNMYLYFYVGQYSQSAIEQTAGLNASLFNNKLDLDVSNATSTTKETVVGWGMPDYTAGVDVTPYNTPRNQFVAPCAGFVNAFFLGTNSEVNLYVNNNRITHFGWNTSVSITGNAPVVFLSKGDTFYGTGMYGSATFPLNNFYPFKGVN